MVEERGEALTEAAGDDCGGVEEAFSQNRHSRQLMVGLVGVVDDDDLGPGCDWLGR